MICYVFKLNKYLEETKKYYHFFEGLFKYYKLPKQKTIESLGINYSSYRVEKIRENVKNDNINKLLKYFEFKEFEEKDIVKYETLLSNIYYCCYYGNNKSYDFYLKQIEDLLENKNILYPVLLLFKVFVYYNKIPDISECKKILTYDLKFLYVFYKTDYFTDDLKYLYLLMLYYFGKVKNNDDILDMKKFCYKEEKLSWLYYSVRAQKAHVDKKDLESIMYIEILIREFKSNNNMNKYLHAINNLAYSYNLEYEYVASLSYTNNLIEYLFSSVEYECWIKYILVHFLYSKLMLKEYSEIVDFLNIVTFDGKYLLNISATTLLICAYAVKDKLMLVKVVKMCEGKDFPTFDMVNKYFKTKDRSVLVSSKEPPYRTRLKNFIIENIKDL